MVEVGRDGAFSVNSVGLRHRPFPLSFSVRQDGGCWLVAAAAARAAELADLLAGPGVAVLVDLDTSSFLDRDLRQLRPGLIAAEQGVDCAVHPIGGWAGGTIGLAPELLVLRPADLPRFLGGGWSPHQLSVLLLAQPPTAAQLDEIALAVGTGGFQQPLLPRIDGSRLWYSGHDDCYLMLESTDPAMPAAVLGRLLALLAGSALTGAGAGFGFGVGATGTVRVPEPARAGLERLLARSPHWVAEVAAASAAGVSVALAALPRPWRLGQGLPGPPDLTAVFDPASGGWRL